MRKIIRGLGSCVAAAALVALAAPSGATEHVVSPQVAQAALDRAAAQRAADLTMLEQALHSPQAERTASLGWPVTQAQRSLAALSDAELADLAARARALGLDPVTGRFDPDVEEMLVIFLLVALVILVLKAV